MTAGSNATGPSKRFTRLHLVRHGEVAARWLGRIYGGLDVPLSEHGELQSRRVAHFFRGAELAAVLSSDLARARYAAERIAAAHPGIELLLDARLREIDRGEWAGLDRTELEALAPGAYDQFDQLEGMIVPPGGETHAQIAARVTNALNDLTPRFAGRTCVLVAHKWVLSSVACRALDAPVERSPRLALPHSSIVTVDWPAVAGERPELVAFGVGALS